MIHSRTRWDRRSQLRDASSNHPVEHRNRQKLVQHAWGTAVVHGYHDGAPQRSPRVAGAYPHGTGAQQTELAI